MNQFDDVFLDQGSFSWRDLLGQGRWETWTPTLSAAKWSDAGTPTVTTRFQVRGRLCVFQFQIAPGTNFTTTAGTDYFTLPIAATGLSGTAHMQNRATKIAAGNGVIDVANSRCYPPTVVASGNTHLIAGWYEV